MPKTLRFNRDNWTGEIGSLTYEPDKPRHFKVDSLPECDFWLEPAQWDTDDQEVIDILGDRFSLHGSDWAPDHRLGCVTMERNGRVEGLSMDYSRDADGIPEETFSADERLLVVAARLIFHTV